MDSLPLEDYPSEHETMLYLFYMRHVIKVAREMAEEFEEDGCLYNVDEF